MHNQSIDTSSKRRGIRVFLRAIHRDTDCFFVGLFIAYAISGIAMILITITGMFILKGKQGFKKRGLILTVLGLVFPIVVLFMFYSF